MEPLPLETARRIARAAVSSLNVSLRVDLDAITPTYSWVVIALPMEITGGHKGNIILRNIRESLRVLTVLSACKGFSLKENSKFWSEVWPDDPTYDLQQPQRAAKWKHLHLRGRPMPSEDKLKFLFQVENAEFGRRSHNDAISMMEELIQVKEAQENESPGFRLTMEILCRHLEDITWPKQVVCAVETPHGDANRWSRLFSTAKDRRMTKMWIPLNLTECFLSAQYCLERSGTLKNVAAMFQTECVVPVKELKLHFGWNSTERSLNKRLREFRGLMWNMVNTRARIRVLHLKGRRFGDIFFFGTICSTLPFIDSLEELHLTLPPVIHNDTRRLLWYWLAVSVLHPQAKSKLRHLNLSHCNVSAEDVEVVSDVLSREWSSVLLQLLTNNPHFQVLSLSETGCTLALAKSGTRIEAEPTRRMFSKPLVTLSHAGEFLVLYERDDWICVFLAGFGCGFIKRQYVVSITKISTTPSPEITHLTSLKIKTVDISSTLVLLRVMGRHLRRLNLDCEAFTNAHLKELMDCCPKLTHLTLRSGKFSDFSMLIDSSCVGACKVSSLHLLTRKVTTQCLESLAKKLSKPVFATTSRLRELRLQTGLLRRHDLEILLGLLKANRTLRCLHIKIAFYLFDEYMPRFLDHRGDCLRGGEEEKRKLAFLSVVSSRTPEEGAKQRIDATMLGKIFEFAYDGERFISLDEYTDRMTIQEIVARANDA